MNTSTTMGDVISSDKVEGTNVYNLAGDKLGSVDDLMINKRSGQVLYAVLEFGGFLGMGTDRYPLPWNMLKYDTTKDGYVVPLDKAKLEKAPRYPEDDMPDYTPTTVRRSTATTDLTDSARRAASCVALQDHPLGSALCRDSAPVRGDRRSASWFNHSTEGETK